MTDELLNALNENQFILKALYKNVDDQILKDGIEKRLLKNAEVIAKGKAQEQSNFDVQMQKEKLEQSAEQTEESQADATSILINRELLNSYQLRSPRNKSFILKNNQYFNKDKEKYLRVISRVEQARKKEKIASMQAYILTALKKEFNEWKQLLLLIKKGE